MKNRNPELYRHPGERAARARLEKIPGFNKFIDMIAGSFNAAAERQVELCSMTRAGPGVYPALHALWERVCGRFGVAAAPLFVAPGFAMRQSPMSAVLRGGNEQPAVVLDAALLAALPEGDPLREMEALLAMQAGSIRLGNAALLAAADAVRWFLDAHGVAGAPFVLPAWGMENWRRFALFSADRAAALALGAPEPVLAWLERLSGAGEKSWGGIAAPDALRVQGLEAISRRDDLRGGTMMRRLALAMNRDNNAGIIRRVDLADWFAGGAPAKILAGELVDPEEAEVNVDAGPSAAYWGEFASCCDGEEEKEKGGGIGGIAVDAATQAFGDLKDSAEKGLGTLFRAGEAFWATLTENSKQK